MSPDPLLFQTLYDDNGCRGGRFRVLREPPAFVGMTRPGFDEECALVERRSAVLAVEFFQGGRPFEFCGAGALCLAHAFATDDEPLSAVASDLTFQLWRRDGCPWVELPANRDFENRHGNRFWFPGQAVEVRLLASPETVATARVSLESLRRDGVDTQILVAVDDNTQQLWFRYFTRFNSKLEDQATGSVFRYLAALELPDNTEYRVRQLSAAGAAARCWRRGDRLFYTGAVRVIEPGCS